MDPASAVEDCEEPKLWTCAACTFANAALLPQCEMCFVANPAATTNAESDLPSKAPMGSFKVPSQKQRWRRAAAAASSGEGEGTAQERGKDGNGSGSVSGDDDISRYLRLAGIRDVRAARVLLAAEDFDLENLETATREELASVGLGVEDCALLEEHSRRTRSLLELGAEAQPVGGGSSGGGPGNGNGAEDIHRRMLADLRELAELLPPDMPLGREELEYVYRALCRRRLPEASAFVVEHVLEAPPSRQQANVRKLVDDAQRWAADQAGALRAQELEDPGGAKRAVLDRFFDRPDDSKTIHRPMAVWDVSHLEKGTRVRYLNGEKVHMKNGREKFVVEETGPPEWDGGSRGKVKTKGKRGPGFV